MANRQLQEILDSGELTNITVPKVSNIIQSTPPPYEEGVSWYDEVTKTLSIYSDIPDVTLNIGQEQYMRVINNTGSTVTNGQVLRHGGVDITTSLPQVELAIADTFQNATIIGIATHDILNGEQGFITTHGKVNDINTASLPAGVPLYLSPTIPGAFQATAPDIVSQVGGVLVSNVSTGSLYVYIESNISVPALFGILSTINDTYDLTSTYQNLVNYQESDFVTVVVDKLVGTIAASASGRYRGTFNIGMTVPTSTSTRSITVQAWDITQASSLFEYAIPVPRDTTEVSRSMAVPFIATAGDEIVMRIKSDVAITGVIITQISYDIQSISVTG